MATKKPYEGHRKRVREELARHGIDEHTPPYKILEFILFHSQPRCDTKPIAQALLKKFHTLSGVFDAEPEDLLDVNGVGIATVLFIKNVLPIAKAYEWDRTCGGTTLETHEQIVDFLKKNFLGETEEIAKLVCMNADGRVINVEEIGRGDLGTVGISARTVLQVVMQNKAHKCILAHNHPSGNIKPSGNDIDVTIRLRNSLATIGASLEDHIILSAKEIMSFKNDKNLHCLFK